MGSEHFYPSNKRNFVFFLRVCRVIKRVLLYMISEKHSDEIQAKIIYHSTMRHQTFPHTCTYLLTFASSLKIIKFFQVLIFSSPTNLNLRYTLHQSFPSIRIYFFKSIPPPASIIFSRVENFYKNINNSVAFEKKYFNAKV